MGNVVHMSMSLDGFVAGPNVRVEHPMGEGGERLHEWMFGGAGDPADARVAAEMFSTETVGAVVMGRTTFTVGEAAWGVDGTFGVPCFVVTHRAAETLVKGPTTFTFVTDGIESALAQAEAAADGKDVNVMGADTVQQLLRAGRLDEIQINLVPVLLGDGTRLFDGLGTGHVELDRARVVESPRMTHLTYRVTG